VEPNNILSQIPYKKKNISGGRKMISTYLKFYSVLCRGLMENRYISQLYFPKGLQSSAQDNRSLSCDIASQPCGFLGGSTTDRVPLVTTNIKNPIPLPKRQMLNTDGNTTTVNSQNKLFRV
jgi:hypothetical protein